MRAVRVIWGFLSHPVLSVAGNLSLLFTVVPLLAALIVAVIGWLVDQPTLFVVAIGLALVEGLAVAYLAVRQRRSPIHSPPSLKGSTPHLSALEIWLQKRLAEAATIKRQRGVRKNEWYFDEMDRWDFANVQRLHEGPDPLAPDLVEAYRENPVTGRADGLHAPHDDAEKDRYYEQRLRWMQDTVDRLRQGDADAGSKPEQLGPAERREAIDNLLYPPADEKRELGEQCATFAMKMRVFNEEQEWKREKAIAHLAEELREAESGIEPRKARKEAETHFHRNVEAAYALEMRDEALSLFDRAREQKAIALKARRVAASPLGVEMGEVPNLFVAIARRLGHEPVPRYALNTTNSVSEDLKGQLDSLMREGMQLVDEFGEPVKPQKRESGGWKLEGGGAPEEWWEKTDDFTMRTRGLLTDRHPALLTDYRDGYNAHVKKERSDDQEPVEDMRSTAEKMLDFANFERSGPRRVLEASLEGLAAARHRLGSGRLEEAA